MKRQKKLVNIVYDGGTIGMIPSPKGLMPPKDASEFRDQLLNAIRTDTELSELIEPKFHILSTEDSVNKRPSSWTKLAYKINELQEGAGNIVLHGTDTMQWSASALQFAFSRGMRVPTFFTGSQLPIHDRWGDASENVLRALRTLLVANQLKFGDVGVVFNDLILNAARCGKRTDDRFGAFDAQNEAFRAGTITTAGPTFYRNALRRRIEGPVALLPHFAGGVFTIELGPITDPEMIDVSIKSGAVKAVLLKSPGEGNVPELFLPFIHKWVHKDRVPVVIASKFLAGKTGGASYKSGSAPLDAGAVAAHDTQDSTAEVKMSWLLSQGVTTSQAFRRAMARNYVGEVTPPRKSKLIK